MELFVYVDDCDAVYKRAVDAGAKPTMPVEDQFWGDRWGALTDPFGFGWQIATHKEDLTKEEIEARQSEFFADGRIFAASKPPAREGGELPCDIEWFG